MARKVIFNMSNTLLATINKINQMDEYLGDLDDLNRSNYKSTRSFLGGFRENEYVENGGPADQSAVAAAEWLHSELAKARLAMFGQELIDSNDSVDSSLEIGTLRFRQVLVADSAVIRRLQVSKLFLPIDSDLSSTSATVLRDSLDSNFYTPSFEGGPIFNTGITIDSGYIKNFSGNHLDVGKWFTTDSGFRTFFNDSTDSINSFVPLFNFGLTIRDSAYIGTLHGPRNLFKFPRPRKPGFPNGYTFDSSTININTPLSFDSGKSTITLLAPDSTDSSANFTLNYDSGRFNRLFVDSATFDTLTMDSDSSGTPFKITTWIIDVDSSFDSQTPLTLLPGGFDSAYRAVFHNRLDSGFQHTSPFIIYESNGADIHFGGYMLSQYDSDNRL